MYEFNGLFNRHVDTQNDTMQYAALAYIGRPRFPGEATHYGIQI